MRKKDAERKKRSQVQTRKNIPGVTVTAASLREAVEHIKESGEQAHLIIVGDGGMGKTSLLSRLAALQLSEQSAIKVEIPEAVYHDRAEQLIALLDEWAADESGEQESTWEQIKSGIDEERERLGMRRLFDG